MSTFSVALCKELLDHVFDKGDYTSPTAIKVGLSSTLPTEAGTNITEPSGGYAKQSTTGSDWATADGTDYAYTRNSSAITFGPVTGAAWAEQLYLCFYDQSDNFLGFAELDDGITPDVGDSVNFAANAVEVRLD